MSGPELIELGRATTFGQTLPLGMGDPVVAARAVRRALAAARRRALDVTDLVVAAPEPIPAEVLAAFARRALGPLGETIACTGLVGAVEEAAALFGAASTQASSARTPGSGLVVAVGLGEDGTVEARCLGERPRPIGSPALSAG